MPRSTPYTWCSLLLSYFREHVAKPGDPPLGKNEKLPARSVAYIIQPPLPPLPQDKLAKPTAPSNARHTQGHATAGVLIRFSEAPHLRSSTSHPKPDSENICLSTQWTIPCASSMATCFLNTDGIANIKPSSSVKEPFPSETFRPKCTLPTTVA